MSEPPFYTPNRTTAPRQPRPGEPLWGQVPRPAGQERFCGNACRQSPQWRLVRPAIGEDVGRPLSALMNVLIAATVH
jgi:hypothetical protein